MKDIKDICVVVQARLGSERVPAKMLKDFAGTTLMDIMCQKILNSKSIPKENFFLSIHEQELLDNASKYELNVFQRSEKSANSEGTPLTDMYEWWDKLPFKYCILLNACAPFMQIETIDGFVEAYKNSDSDGLFGVMKKKNYFGKKSHWYRTVHNRIANFVAVYSARAGAHSRPDPVRGQNAAGGNAVPVGSAEWPALASHARRAGKFT